MYVKPDSSSFVHFVSVAQVRYFTLLAFLFLAMPGRATAQDEAIPAVRGSEPTEEFTFGDAGRWLPEIKSMSLRSVTRYEMTPEAIAKNLREIKRQHPDIKDPDPLAFTQLIPVKQKVVEDAFDQTRYRSFEYWQTVDRRRLSSDLRIWDGQKLTRCAVYDAFRKNRELWTSVAPEAIEKLEFFGPMRNAGWFNRQPPQQFWWKNSPRMKLDYEESFGNPSDYILVGQETFHGSDCDVYLSAVGNQSDRFYVGVKDRRWFGAKEGIIAFGDFEAYNKKYRTAVNNFLGTSFEGEISLDTWEKLAPMLRKLPQEKKVRWCRLLYTLVAKDYVPCFEYWFSDFRDLGNERIIPFCEERLLYDYEDQKTTFVQAKYTMTITEIRLDAHLEDQLFVFNQTVTEAGERLPEGLPKDTEIP